MNEKQWRDKEDEKILEALRRKKKAEDLKYLQKYGK